MENKPLVSGKPKQNVFTFADGDYAVSAIVASLIHDLIAKDPQTFEKLKAQTFDEFQQKFFKVFYRNNTAALVANLIPMLKKRT